MANKVSPLDEIKYRNARLFIPQLQELRTAYKKTQLDNVSALTLDEVAEDAGNLLQSSAVLNASEFPSQDTIDWIADDNQATLATSLGFYVSGVSSGQYVLGKGKNSGHYGVVGMAAMNDTQSLGQYTQLLQLDTQGNSGRAFVEANVSGTLRRSYLPAVGWLPYAYQYGYDAAQDPTTASFSMAANGGCVAIPVFVPAPMMLRSVTVWNGNTSAQRSWNWGLYEQYTQTESASENSLTQKAAGAAAETFTPSAQSARTITAASAPIYLGTGLYWLVVQNTHASNTFDVGRVNPAATMGNMAQSKVVTIPLGDTLDFVAATWTARTGEFGVRLNGEVFGDTSIF